MKVNCNSTPAHGHHRPLSKTAMTPFRRYVSDSTAEHHEDSSQQQQRQRQKQQRKSAAKATKKETIHHKPPQGSSKIPPAHKHAATSRHHHHRNKQLKEEEFLLMQVKVTVYGLSGIICTCPNQKGETKNSRKKGSLSKLHQNASSSSIGSTSTMATEASSTKYTNSSSSHDVDEEYDNNDSIPTTAVVSANRTVLSSFGSKSSAGPTTIETFVPSLPLVPTSSSSSFRRFKAQWINRTDEDSYNPALLRHLPPPSHSCNSSTFELIRVLQRDSYHSASAGSNSFVHETIPLKLYLGHGTDPLLFLGVASIAVTGEEQGTEVIRAVPIQQSTPRQSDHWNNGRGDYIIEKKKTKKKLTSFTVKRSSSSKSAKFSGNGGSSYFEDEDGNRRYYKLDDSATVRIGVMVVPQPHKTKQVVAALEEERVRDSKNKELSQILDNLTVICDDWEEGKEVWGEHVSVPPPRINARQQGKRRRQKILEATAAAAANQQERLLLKQVPAEVLKKPIAETSAVFQEEDEGAGVEVYLHETTASKNNNSANNEKNHRRRVHCTNDTDVLSAGDEDNILLTTLSSITYGSSMPAFNDASSILLSQSIPGYHEL